MDILYIVFFKKRSDATLWDREASKMPLSSFSVGHLLLGMLSTLKSSLAGWWWWHTHLIPAQEAEVGRSLWVQLHILLRGLCPTLLSALELHMEQTPEGLMGAASLSVSSHVLRSWFRESCHFGVLHPSGSYTLSVSFLSSEGRDLVKISYWRLSDLRSCTLYILSSYSFLYLFPLATEGSFSDDGWTRHRSMSRAECDWESFYCDFFFIYNSSNWFPS